MTSSPSRPPASPLARPEPWDAVAEGYETDTRPTLEPFSRLMLEWTDPPAGKRALDVAAGPGTTSFLLATRFDRVDAVDFAPSMLAVLQRRARDEGVANVRDHVMDGQALGFRDDLFDFGVSMFGLMFFPDPVRGLRELSRVLKPGAMACMSSWPPAEQSPGMAILFEMFEAAVPDWKRPPAMLGALDSQARLNAAMAEAGFIDVQSREMRADIPYVSPLAMWEAMERGNAPLQMMKGRFDAQAWAGVRQRAVDFLARRMQWPTELQLNALATRGRKPG